MQHAGSSPSRDWTCAPLQWNCGALTLDCQKSLRQAFYMWANLGAEWSPSLTPHGWWSAGPLVLLSPSKSKMGCRTGSVYEVSEFLETWRIWQVKARRSRQQEPEESPRGKRLWLGWKAWLGSQRLQDVNCATGDGNGAGQRPLGQPNLLQGLLRLAGDQPRETLAGFRAEVC